MSALASVVGGEVMFVRFESTLPMRFGTAVETVVLLAVFLAVTTGDPERAAVVDVVTSPTAVVDAAPGTCSAVVVVAPSVVEVAPVAAFFFPPPPPHAAAISPTAVSSTSDLV